jgi:hypothetical protein
MAREKNGCLLAIFNALISLLRGRVPIEPLDHPIVDQTIVDAGVVLELPYRVRDDLLSPAERSFCLALAAALGDRGLVFPNVRIADVLHRRSARPATA